MIITGGTRPIGPAVAEGLRMSRRRPVVASRKAEERPRNGSPPAVLGVFDVVALVCHGSSLDDVRRSARLVTVDRVCGWTVVDTRRIC